MCKKNLERGILEMKKTTKVLAAVLGVVLSIISITALVLSVNANYIASEVPKQIELQRNKEESNKNKIGEIEFFSLEEGKTRKTLEMYKRGLLSDEEAWNELTLICAEISAIDEHFRGDEIIEKKDDVETALNSMINELSRQAQSLEGDIFYN